MRTIIKAPTEPAGDLRQALFQYCAEHLVHYNRWPRPDETEVNAAFAAMIIPIIIT